MELKDFIKEAIENIVEGVVSAQETIKDKGAQINPRKVQFRENGQWNNHNSGMPRFVEFDVGLTSANKSGTTEGIGVFLGSISLGQRQQGRCYLFIYLRWQRSSRFHPYPYKI